MLVQIFVIVSTVILGSSGFGTDFENVETRLCLDAENGSVFASPCNNKGLSQSWLSYGNAGFMNVGTRTCLEMSLEGRVSTQYCSNSAPRQQWDTSSQRIQNVGTNLCLNENASGQTCTEQPNMQWNRRT